MAYPETTFDVRRQKLKLKDVIHSLFNYYGMRRNGIQHHAPPDDPDSLISLLLILLCGLVWFYTYKCYICLPISGHGL